MTAPSVFKSSFPYFAPGQYSELFKALAVSDIEIRCTHEPGQLHRDWGPVMRRRELKKLHCRPSTMSAPSSTQASKQALA